MQQLGIFSRNTQCGGNDKEVITAINVDMFHLFVGILILQL